MPLKGKRELFVRIRANGDKLVRAIALETHRRLIQKTPVDTGRARNNWNLARGKPDASTTNEDSYNQSGAAALQQGASLVAEIQVGDVIYSTNALPYIPELERGSSKQAPNGMVALTVAEMSRFAAKAVAEIARGE